MFTGLVEAVGTICAIAPAGPGKRFSIVINGLSASVAVGDSIAIDGCCLTVVRVENAVADFEAGEETLSKTQIGSKQDGDHVNLEAALRVGDRLGGHYVTGHVDAVGSLVERRDHDEWSEFRIRFPSHLKSQFAPKGSAAVDGVSLTVVDVEPELFSVCLIPHTLKATTLGDRQPGDALNLETDVLAKYVAQAVSAQMAS